MAYPLSIRATSRPLYVEPFDAIVTWSNRDVSCFTNDTEDWLSVLSEAATAGQILLKNKYKKLIYLWSTGTSLFWGIMSVGGTFSLLGTRKSVLPPLILVLRERKQNELVSHWSLASCPVLSLNLSVNGTASVLTKVQHFSAFRLDRRWFTV